ncbi:MAG TPA: hypothetical protein VGH73_11735 [Thermoanaerobaculia bacterium]
MRRSCAALGLLVVGLASPALAAGAGGGAWSRLFGWVSDSKPPWAVEAPGGAGERYGLGLDLFFEHQESLRITFMEQRLQTLDLQTGRDVGEIIRTDPGLLNRKFDLRWDLKGVGAQPAVALPLPRTLGIYPTLVLQAAGADVSLDFHDRNRPGDSSSLSGRGPLFGAGLDLTTSLCRSCPWFAGASYFFQKLPSLTVDRSPAFGPQGFAVLEDKVRLGRDVHEVSTRAGYGFPGNRALSYLGVRHRWTDLDINDHLRTRDPFGVFEMSLDSRTRLKSEVTLALAGVEARLGPGLFGRLETSVGGGDRGALLRVVYLPSHPGSPSGNPPERPTPAETARIAARIREIRTEFAAVEESLPEAVALTTLLALLDRLEREVLAALPYPEYAALRDLVTYRFQQAQVRLRQGTAQGRMSLPSRAVQAAFNPRPTSRIDPAAGSSERSLRKSEASGAFGPILDLLDLMWKRFNDNDVRVNPCVKTEPALEAAVELYPLSYRDGGGRILSNDQLPLSRGLYAYSVIKRGYEPIECPADRSEGCRLNLLTLDRPLIRCKLSLSKKDPEASCFVTDEPPGRWECKSR